MKKLILTILIFLPLLLLSQNDLTIIGGATTGGGQMTESQISDTIKFRNMTTFYDTIRYDHRITDYEIITLDHDVTVIVDSTDAQNRNEFYLCVNPYNSDSGEYYNMDWSNFINDGDSIFDTLDINVIWGSWSGTSVTTGAHYLIRYQYSAIDILDAPVLSTGTATADSIPLSWTDPNSSPNEDSIEVQSSSTGAGNWSTIHYAAQDATSWGQGGLTEDTTVYYRVRALGDGVNSANSAYSNIVSETTTGGHALLPFGNYVRYYDIYESTITDTASTPVRVVSITDISSQNVTARQLVHATRPNYINSDSMDFNADVLDMDTPIAVSDTFATFFFVINRDAAADDIITLESGSHYILFRATQLYVYNQTGKIFTIDATWTDKILVEIECRSDSVRLYRNGEHWESLVGGFGDLDGEFNYDDIGNTGGQDFDGYIHHFSIRADTTSAFQRDSITNYLFDLHNIP